MLNIKDHKTINMFDPFDYLGPKRRILIFRPQTLADFLPDHQN